MASVKKKSPTLFVLLLLAGTLFSFRGIACLLMGATDPLSPSFLMYFAVVILTLNICKLFCFIATVASLNKRFMFYALCAHILMTISSISLRLIFDYGGEAFTALIEEIVPLVVFLWIYGFAIDRFSSKEKDVATAS